MAKKSKVVKEKKRQEIVAKYADLRRELKAKGTTKLCKSFRVTHLQHA